MESQKVTGRSFSAEPNDEPGGLAGSEPGGLSGTGRKPRENFSELKVYEAMTDAVKSSIEEFLQPLQSAPDSTYVVKAIVRDDYLPKFLSAANLLADTCCQKLVKIIRTHSRIATVREAPTPELAKRIRDACFKPLDTILACYAGAIRKVEVINNNISKIRDELHKQMTSGSLPEKSNQTPGAERGGEATEAWATDEELARQHERLIRSKTQAYTRIVEYLNGLIQLPDAVMAYGCDKCFAGEVSYELELEQVAKIRAALKYKLPNAIETLGRVMAATRNELEMEKAFIASNIQQEKFHQVLEEMVEDKMERKAKIESRFQKIGLFILFSFLAAAVIFFWWFANFM